MKLTKLYLISVIILAAHAVPAYAVRTLEASFGLEQSAQPVRNVDVSQLDSKHVAGQLQQPAGAMPWKIVNAQLLDDKGTQAHAADDELKQVKDYYTSQQQTNSDNSLRTALLRNCVVTPVVAATALGTAIGYKKAAGTLPYSMFAGWLWSWMRYAHTIKNQRPAVVRPDMQQLLNKYQPALNSCIAAQQDDVDRAVVTAKQLFKNSTFCNCFAFGTAAGVLGMMRTGFFQETIAGACWHVAKYAGLGTAIGAVTARYTDTIIKKKDAIWSAVKKKLKLS